MVSSIDFFNAAETGDTDRLQEYLKEIKNLEVTDIDNLTALGKAVYNNQIETVQLLLNAKASFNAMGKDGKTLIQWAREQKDGDIPKLLMLYSYIDRICNNSLQYKKAKLEVGSCDVCSGNVTEGDTLTLSIDEVFESESYTDCLYRKSMGLEKAKFADTSKEKIIEYIKDQVTRFNHNDCFVVCNDCIVRFFYKIVYGNFQEYLETTVENMMNSQEE
ncbi:MAG: ankyrin repeat domain-containing protein [Spirochaetia bacterium]|nr:ankyrin repeat domain-containing protein [Spirochaetia bacterium]